jgi:uncharacterized membrane protein
MSAELTIPGAIHLAAIVPAVVIGVVQLASKKGTPRHKLLGRIWVASMIVAAVSSFWIMQLSKGAGFSVIHLLSLWVLICLAFAIWFIRRGNVRAHQRFMVGVMLGVAGAGLGALMPGRFLAQLFS